MAIKCTGCHGEAGGLAMTTYADLLNGGANGSVINNAAPEASQLIAVQTTGEHPGLLSAEELTRITLWISNGAPEE